MIKRSLCFSGSVILLATHLFAAEITREEILQKLTLPEAGVESSGAMRLSPPEHEPYLMAIEQVLMKNPEMDLAKFLYRYQLAYPNPENETAARILGWLFLEQHRLMVEAFEDLKPTEKIKVMVYLGYGWEKAIEGKNPSIPRIAEKQRKLDRMKGALMNR